MRPTPNYKADLVQRSSIATAVNRRTHRNVTNRDVDKIARHLGIDAIDKGDHEYYYTKLQAMGITDALMHKLAQENDSAKTPTPPPAEMSEMKGTQEPEQALATSDQEKIFTKEDAYILLSDQDLVDFLRRRNYEVTATKTIIL